MRTEVIKAGTIDAAAERLLHELKEDTNSTRSISSRDNVIYFDGWDRLGASAVLRAVAERLAAASEAPAGLRFDQIIHVDCSKWESRRALQRAIAEQLELPAEAMEMFDRQDEEDDFDGVSKGSRLEIPEVLKAMYRRIQDLNRRFLMIFHNGSGEEIDLTIYGFFLSGFSTNKVLWTFQGRFRLYPRVKVDRALHKSTGTTTDVFLSASHLEEQDPQELWSVLVRQEAAEIITNIDGPARVADSFLHMLKLCSIGHHFMMDYDLATHACNYWMCDGIIQQLPQGDVIDADDDDGSWRSADALLLEMQLDEDYYHYNNQYFPSHLVWYGKSMLYRTSPSYGFLQVPAGAIPNADLLQDVNKLTVLKLSRRTFSFSSPPFLYCHSLKFLWLDHCQDQEISSVDGFLQEEKKKITTDGAGKEEDFRRCFQRLWVLDVRYTRCDRILSAQMMGLMTQLRELNVTGAEDWDMGQLQRRLPNIRKLRVTKSTVRCSSCSDNELFSGMNKMELLDFSGNRIMSGMRSISAADSSSLETIIIDDGCAGLEKISLKGCAKLKNILLRGLFENLYSLDISGTAVKTLDLSAMRAAQEHDDHELFLLDCDKLCAILWPREHKRKSYLGKRREYLGKLRIGTSTHSSPSSLSVMHGSRAPSGYNSFISIRDARLLRSLVPFKEYFDRSLLVHVEISSGSSSPAVDVGVSKDERIESGIGSEQQGRKLCEIGFFRETPVTLRHVPVRTQARTRARRAIERARRGWGSLQGPSRAGLTEVSSEQQVLVNLKQQQQPEKVYADVHTRPADEASEGPRAPCLYSEDCYVYIQDQLMRAKLPQSGEVTSPTITIPDFICDNAKILHVHDSLSITSIPCPAPPLGSPWNWLEWCRVERCTKLDRVFTAPQLGGGQEDKSSVVLVFNKLRTFWASQLPKAHFIWNWSTSSSVFHFDRRSFEHLKFLHLDFCPRLIHVLPLPLHHSLGKLETLEIVWCGDLREVFPLDTDSESHQQQQQSFITVEFQSLKHIHLHELPMLQGICGRGRMSAPNLETVKIRGCRSLTRLPAVGGDRSKTVKCDCEKEWWDRLKWDGEGANHHPSLYLPNY